MLKFLGIACYWIVLQYDTWLGTVLLLQFLSKSTSLGHMSITKQQPSSARMQHNISHHVFLVQRGFRHFIIN